MINRREKSGELKASKAKFHIIHFLQEIRSLRSQSPLGTRRVSPSLLSQDRGQDNYVDIDEFDQDVGEIRQRIFGYKKKAAKDREQAKKVVKQRVKFWGN